MPPVPAAAQRVQREITGIVLRQLEDIEGSILVKMKPLLARAEQEVQDDLMMWLRRQNGENEFTAQVYRSALARIQRARKTLDAAGAELGKGLKRTYEDVGTIALTTIEKQVAGFAKAFGDAIGGPSFDTAAVVLREKGPLFKQFTSSAKRYGGRIGDRLTQELAIGRIRGESVFETQKRLTRTIPKLTEMASNAAERLARTEVMNTYNVVAAEGLDEWGKEDPDALGMWDASMDARVCPICAAFDGQTIELNKGAKFTGAKGRTVERPPAHPNCRCIITPWKESWRDIGPKRKAAPAPKPVPPPKPPKPPKPAPLKPVPPPPVRTAPLPMAPPPAPAPPPLKVISTPPAAPKTSLSAKDHLMMADVLTTPKSKWFSTIFGGKAVTRGEERKPWVELLKDRYGMEHRDIRSPKGTGRMREPVLRFVPESKLPGANAQHTWEGAIDIKESRRLPQVDFHRAMAKGKMPTVMEADTARTYIHELLHGHSTMGVPGCYQGAGRLVEEVATEVSARKVMRDMITGAGHDISASGWDRLRLPQAGAKYFAAGSYGGWIHDAIRIVEEVTGEGWESAAARVETASIASKGAGKAWTMTQDEHAMGFIRELGLSDNKRETRVQQETRVLQKMRAWKP